MLDQLFLINMPPKHDEIDEDIRRDCFYLKTCQRHILVGLGPISLNILSKISPEKSFSLYQEEAYSFLVEVICGLRSKILAENEIAGQFKDAFTSYRRSAYKNSYLVKVLEKIQKDAKEIRSRHLIGIGQKTYASITRKKILSNEPEKVLILGSGHLAKDLIHQLIDKVPVYMAARNINAMEIYKNQFPNLNIVNWFLPEEYSKFSHIINSIGTNESLLSEDFFNNWVNQHPLSSRYFIDLGSPSPISTEYGVDHNILKLKNIFDEGEIHDHQKKHKLAVAKLAIREITEKRFRTFTLNFPFGWEELQFA